MTFELFEHSVFKTSIYSTFLEQIDLHTLISAIEDLEKNNKGRLVSNKGGFQSIMFNNTNYDNSAVFHLFETHINPIVRKVCEQWSLPWSGEQLCYWYNINRKYNYNAQHWHPRSYISGVFYIRVPADSGNITFLRSDNETDRMSFIADYLDENKKTVNNPYINMHHWIPPAVNKLILFPGHLAHHVDQNLTNDDDDRRISLSFNYFP
jgi:uncharacterized protein (TIGR02466 family)